MKLFVFPFTPLLAGIITLTRTEASNRHLQSSTTTIPSGSTPTTSKFWMSTAHEDIFELILSAGLCEEELATPMVETETCRDQCGAIGKIDSEHLNCSCNSRCLRINDCCLDFMTECPFEYRQGYSLFFDTGLTEVCESDGFAVVSGCLSFGPGENEIILHDAAKGLDLNITIPTLGPRTLTDYLGKSVEKVEDKENGFIFLSKEVYDECRLSNSVPMLIPRTVVLDCRLQNRRSMNLTLDTKSTLDDYLEQKNSLFTRLFDFLETCEVSEVVHEKSSAMQRCHLPAVIECYHISKGVFTATIAGLCQVMTGKKKDVAFLDPGAYALFSEKATFTSLKSGSPCYYYMPNERKMKDSEHSPIKEAAFIKIAETSVKTIKTALNQTHHDSPKQPMKTKTLVRDVNSIANQTLYDKSEKSSTGNTQVGRSSYTVTIDALGFKTLLECPSLDVYLHQCLFIGINDVGITSGTNKDNDEAVFYSLRADLKHKPKKVKDNLQMPVPFRSCICLTMFVALQSLKTFETTSSSLGQTMCDLKLRLFERDLVKGVWRQPPRMKISHVGLNLTQEQQENAAALDRTLWDRIRNTEATKSNLNLQSKLDLLKVINEAGGIKTYLEDFMVRTTNACPDDNLGYITFCLSVHEHVTWDQSTSEVYTERCMFLDLDPSNSAKDFRRSEFTEIMYRIVLSLCIAVYSLTSPPLTAG
ncbi:hypothetical protein PoB_002393200 [Plakobranchus ocellatus]|uniref:SMB domain-containing protein n=1 Tax=Plakobranchus ocellatus TaxID=259542 RepID=A0AAV3ZQG1_9GAST|nr:hypothetical protein PoB_002393200 [Plakobranchus ocellatus]